MFLGFIALIPFFFIFEFKKIKGKKISYNFILIYITLLAFFLAEDLHYSSTHYFIQMLQMQQYLQFLCPDCSCNILFLFSKRSIGLSAPVFVCIIGGYLLTEINNVTVRLGDSLVLLGSFFGLFILFIYQNF